ncbi:sensor domain-containing diguanylate cyclase [Fusibacter bizertensis]
MQETSLLERISALENNPKDIIKQLFEAIDFDKEIETLYQAQNYLLLGRGYLLTSRSDISIRFLNKALDFFVKNKDPMSLFQCYSNLGIVYREEKQYDLALKALNKSYNIAFDLDDFSYTILALVNLASVYSSLDNIHKAIELLDKALEYKDKLKNNKILGDLYNNYAFILLGKSDYEEALEFLKKAYIVYEGIYGDVIRTNMLIVISNIGEAYVMLGDYDNAELNINKALRYASEQHIKFIEIDCHNNLSKVYEARGDYKSALEHHKIYTKLKDEIQEKENLETIEALMEKLEHESKKSEEEINLLRNVELKNKTTELEKTLKNLSMIGQIGQRLTSSMDLDQIYEILRNFIYKLMTVDMFGLALYNQDEGIIIYKYFEEGGRSLPLKEVDVNDHVSLAAYCIQNNKDVFIKTFDNEYASYYPNSYYLGLGNNKEKSTQCIIFSRLISEEKCIGVITVQNYESDAYSDSDFEVIKALASYVAIAISNAQKKNIISEKAKELEYLSLNDPLTELYNRRFFNIMTKTYCLDEQALPIGLVIGDMNYLKEINDHYGHLIGDQHLIDISKIMKKAAGNNPVFRLGGDEFAILVKNTTDEFMLTLLKKIKDECEQSEIVKGSLSISLGYEVKYDKDSSIEDLFASAESKMYAEKKNGQRRS